MKLKNLTKDLMIAGLIIAATVNAALASSPVCPLIVELKGVFATLRTLAFIGAAFVLATWAWKWIQTGVIDFKDADRKKIIAMIVGLSVLFLIGMILTIVLNGRVVDCPELLQPW